MLKEKSKKAKEPPHQPLDAIAWAMKRFPGLTREEAEEMAAMQGFD